MKAAMYRCGLVMFVSLTGACATAPDSSHRSDALGEHDQEMVLEQGALSFTLTHEWLPAGEPFAPIRTHYHPKHGEFAIIGDFPGSSARVVDDAIQLSIFWQADPNDAAGTYPCTDGMHGMFVTSDALGGRYSPFQGGASCTLVVTEVGAFGERIRGTWDGMLFGIDSGELRPFSGTFDVIRDKDDLFGRTPD